MPETAVIAPIYTTLKRNGDTPLYAQIERNIEINIATNRLKQGDLIPGEVELSNRYQVSRVTVQQAIKELVSAGLLYRIQGKGTFVAQSAIERTESNITSFFYEMIESGRKTKAEVSMDVIQPEPEVRRILNLDSDELVIITRRLRYVDDEPIVYQVNTTRQSLCPDLTTEDLSTQSFQYTLEMKYNLRLAELEENLTCIKPDEHLSQLLEISPPIPVLVATRMLYSTGGRIIGMAKTHFRGDRYAYKVVRNISLSNIST